MTNPRRPDDPRISTADLAAAGDRATERPADRNAGQRPVQPMQPAQPAQPVQPAAARQPAERDVTLRFATPDVIHGILVTGTNVNTMVVPGYVAQVHTKFTKTGDLLMPCHEYCGLGHTQMIATVKVVPPEEFKPDAEGRASCGDDR